MPFSPLTLGFAFVGGVLPALVWLYFLLREDERCPEPKSMILLAVITGMLAVLLAIPSEQFFRTFADIHLVSCADASVTCFPIILGWATIEETLKYVLAAVFILTRRSVDESLDLVMYMITVALGFAALENTLFLIGPLLSHNIFGPDGFLVTDNLRFVGSTLVHIISSACIGFALAFSYRKNRAFRAAAASIGLILAIGLHTFFNFFIIQSDGFHRVAAFFVVWTGAVVFLALFEILKYFRYHNLPKNTC